MMETVETMETIETIGTRGATLPSSSEPATVQRVVHALRDLGPHARHGGRTSMRPGA